jgi:hypothetical protein
MNKLTEAKCTGSMLTVGFHSANPPLIWRFDLERNHSFTLALQGEDGGWEFGVTTPKGDFYPVVHFAAREDAEDAFTKVERALLTNRSTGSIVAKASMGLVAVVLLVLSGFFLFGLYVNHQASVVSNGTSTTTVVQPVAPGGVPLAADDVLTPPR